LNPRSLSSRRVAQALAVRRNGPYSPLLAGGSILGGSGSRPTSRRREGDSPSPAPFFVFGRCAATWNLGSPLRKARLGSFKGAPTTNGLSPASARQPWDSP